MKSDRAYVYDIDKLIPLAEKEARAKVKFSGVYSEPRPSKLGVIYNHCFFTEHFHRAMKRLAIENELRTF